MRSAWVWICSWCAYLYLRLGIYRSWSRLYRHIWERDWIDVAIRPVASFAELVQLVRGGLRYRPDGWRQGMDAISHPARVLAQLRGEIAAHAGVDCDDYALAIVAALNASPEVMRAEGIEEVRLLTVTWMEGWKPGGHNVCLLRYADGTLRYMDYGEPSRPCATVEELVALVRSDYAPGSELLAHAVQREDLRVESVARG